VDRNGNKTLQGRTLYLHPMSQASARLLSSTFRSLGLDARITPPSDSRTMELGSMYSEGDECLPKKITLGDYLKVTEQEDFDPGKTAFFMPTAHGPCRFGQYWPALENVLKKRGQGEIMIVNPNSNNGYEGVSGDGLTFYRMAWLGLLAADILRKMLLKIRPYETVKGTTDRVYEQALRDQERILEQQGIAYRDLIRQVRDQLIVSRDEFRNIGTNYVKEKPLIAVVGEIFCRHNRFANENMIRKLEEHGAETWLADVAEWVFYTDWSRMTNLVRKGKRFSVEMLKTIMKQKVMKRDEHTLMEPFHDDFVGYEEPESTDVIVEHGKSYLPATGALGEMALSIGRAGYCYGKGVDGIVDISPFSCMNGIVTEAIYPSFSRDHNDIPCRVFYFDGVNSDLDRDIGIFMELVRGYMSRKTVKRTYPSFFHDSV